MKSTPPVNQLKSIEHVQQQIQKVSKHLYQQTQKEAQDLDASVWDGLANETNDDSIISINQFAAK